MPNIVGDFHTLFAPLVHESPLDAALAVVGEVDDDGGRSFDASDDFLYDMVGVLDRVEIGGEIFVGEVKNVEAFWETVF